MIYERPQADTPIDQGDIIDDCPIAYVDHFDFAKAGDVVRWTPATPR